jgi:hypothetical protein
MTYDGSDLRYYNKAVADLEDSGCNHCWWYLIRSRIWVFSINLCCGKADLAIRESTIRVGIVDVS